MRACHGGTSVPQNGGFIKEKISSRWMIWGYPIYGTHRFGHVGKWVFEISLPESSRLEPFADEVREKMADFHSFVRSIHEDSA